MGYLIIGHVSDTTARIWVRGEKKTGDAKLRYRPSSGGPWKTETTALAPHLDYAAVIPLVGLTPATGYECEVSYAKAAPAKAVRAGRFTTAPSAPGSLSFILASCNYSKLGFLTAKNVDRAWTRIGQLADSAQAAFMIHCGDQVYADLPGVPDPDLPYYQREYRNAWRRMATARVLAGLPHYMMLDDHEIFDAFANDAQYVGRPAQQIRDFALEAYRQYQHFHNPQTFPPPALYYSFEHSGVHFFALDVRSERWAKEENDPQMIGVVQMREFKDWLAAHAAEPKFVVTSVPFVCEVRDKGDKWCGDQFAPQRGEIIGFLAENGIGRLCFLTGDLHCSCHAEMRVTPAAGPALTVHELMSSPINQATSGIHSFVDRPERTTAGGARYATLPLDLAQFYGEHSNVMTLLFDRAAGRLDWRLYRTKDDAMPPVPVRAGSFAL